MLRGVISSSFYRIHKSLLQRESQTLLPVQMRQTDSNFRQAFASLGTVEKGAESNLLLPEPFFGRFPDAPLMWDKVQEVIRLHPTNGFPSPWYNNLHHFFYFSESMDEIDEIEIDI